MEGQDDVARSVGLWSGSKDWGDVGVGGVVERSWKVKVLLITTSDDHTSQLNWALQSPSWTINVIRCRQRPVPPTGVAGCETRPTPLEPVHMASRGASQYFPRRIRLRINESCSSRNLIPIRLRRRRRKSLFIATTVTSSTSLRPSTNTRCLPSHRPPRRTHRAPAMSTPATSPLFARSTRTVVPAAPHTAPPSCSRAGPQRPFSPPPPLRAR